MKYIDADKLITEIERLKSQSDGYARYFMDKIIAYIESLQQEQLEPVKGKFVFPKRLYARTLDNKTIDVSYCPQDMTAIEYVRNDFVEQEKPEVDL